MTKENHERVLRKGENKFDFHFHGCIMEQGKERRESHLREAQSLVKSFTFRQKVIKDPYFSDSANIKHQMHVSGCQEQSQQNVVVIN